MPCSRKRCRCALLYFNKFHLPARSASKSGNIGRNISKSAHVLLATLACTGEHRSSIRDELKRGIRASLLAPLRKRGSYAPRKVVSSHDDDEGPYPCILANMPTNARRSSGKELIR